MSEQWKEIDGSPGYWVSDMGRVRSGDGPGSRILRGSIVEGYARHRLTGLGPRRTVSAQELVLTAFVGLRPDGLEALHRNDIPSDNRLTNLWWGTRSDNLHDAVRNGRHAMANKTHCKRGHELSGENIVTTVKANGSKARQCRTCKRALHAIGERRRRAARRAS